MGYVIAVHLPFAGMALLPVLFGWPTILYPTHIVFSVRPPPRTRRPLPSSPRLAPRPVETSQPNSPPTVPMLQELVIDPSCSVVFEMEPAEPDVMNRPPRKLSKGVVTLKSLVLSLAQGCVILAGSLFLFCTMTSDVRDLSGLGAGEDVAIHRTHEAPVCSAATCLGCVRRHHYYHEAHHYERWGAHTPEERLGQAMAMAFGGLIVGNLGIILTNRSPRLSLIASLRVKNPAMMLIIPVTLVALMASIYMPGLRELFRFHPLPLHSVVGFVLVGLICPLSFEAYKAPTVQAPTVQAPTVQAPTVQAPTVQAPTVQAPRHTQFPANMAMVRFRSWWQARREATARPVDSPASVQLRMMEQGSTLLASAPPTVYGRSGGGIPMTPVQAVAHCINCPSVSTAPQYQLPLSINCPPVSTAPQYQLPPSINCPPVSTAPQYQLPPSINCPPVSTAPQYQLPPSINCPVPLLYEPVLRASPSFFELVVLLRRGPSPMHPFLCLRFRTFVFPFLCRRSSVC
ncbi:ion-transporting P-type ATPase [Paratrimastix pyriformis]|uniref:Ion-transporting P-type ATPase n=1 Tax=Paratrimastix pyriformis TaxID=342808 RepID=A0ABQ8UP99_9EUKA|nr:ion-transporting P-type ATPase [Paratrimastix pyriformis]